MLLPTKKGFLMNKKGKSDPLKLFGTITKVTPNKYNKIIIETSLGKRYFSDLTFFQNIHCYPKMDEWNNVTIDKSGLDLIWPGKFRVSLGQIIDHSFKVDFKD